MNEEAKIASFKNLVYNDARSRRDTIMKNMEIEKEEKIRRARREIKEKYEHMLKRGKLKADKRNNNRLAAAAAEHKKELLNAREDLIDSVFLSVKEKLSDYLISSEYKEKMKEKISLALEEMSGDAVIIINGNDDALKGLGFKYEIADEDILGGCIVRDRTLRVQKDLTVKTRLETLRGEFLQEYKLKL